MRHYVLMSVAESEGTAQALERSQHLRFVGAGIAGIVLAACLAVFVGIAVVSTERRSLLIGTVSGFQIQLAVTAVGLLAFAAGILLITRRWWLVAAAPFAFIATVGAVGVFLMSGLAATYVTPLMSDGYPTGYVAIEQPGGGDAVYSQEGAFVTRVAAVVADDFLNPFMVDAYVARTHGECLDVWYNQQTASRPLTSGAASFSLPLSGSVSARCE
jgi:hypothetical protein